MADSLALEYQNAANFRAIELGSGRVAALSVAVQSASTQLESDCGAQPDLPVREDARWDGETVGPVQVGRDSPGSEYSGKKGGGRQKSGNSERDAPILVALLDNLWALAEPNPYHHG